MAQIRLNLWFDPVPEGYVRVMARPRRNLAIIAANELFPAPHANPRNISLYVPTPETHQVTIYETPDEETLGIQRNQYESMPAYYDGQFISDTVLVVGRGTEKDPTDPDVIIDPVAGETEVYIPSLADRTVARIFRESASRYMRPEEYSLLTEDNHPGLRLLQSGDKFYSGDLGGEGFRIEYAPYYANNTGQAIFDLTGKIEDHIDDTDNPHEVDKEQVGLGNLPNATSNSYQEEDEDKLATAKAVHDLWASSNNAKIIGIKSVFIGNVGAISTGGDITAVVNNQGGVDSKVTINHGLNIVGNYMVWPVIMGRSLGSSGSSQFWDIDNEVIMCVGNSFSPNTFDLFFKKLFNVSTSITVHYMLIKTS